MRAYSLGFWHEQSRDDRDDYITINFHNVQGYAKSNFKRYSLREIEHLGTEYDYCSVMHYAENVFSVVSMTFRWLFTKPIQQNTQNGQPTITPKKENNCGHKIGHAPGLSENDILKINRMYSCSEEDKEDKTTKEPSWSEETTVSLHKSCWYTKQWIIIFKDQPLSSTTTATSEQYTAKPEVCVDTHNACDNWQKYENGCEKHAISMQLLCPATCSMFTCLIDHGY